MIQVKNLSKRYSSGFLALDQLNLEVESGEIFGFLGPNGAGKTTTIRVLTTLSLPTSGTAHVAGFDVLRQAGQVRESIGYVSQESGVEYCLTGRENLLLQGRLYHLDRKTLSRRLDESLALMDLTEVADRMVSRYSGGMRRKLDIASALLHQPRLLFLDEPTLGLDPQSRLNLWEYIRRINVEQGVTIFLTTHYLEEADKLAGRVGILDQGALKAMDTPEKLKDQIGGDVLILALENALQGQQFETLQQRLRALPSVRDLVIVDQECSVYVNRGQEALPRILQMMDSAGMTVRAATLCRPSLDDIFLKYTGRRLQEEDKQEGEAEWEKWWKPDADNALSEGEGSTGSQEDWKKWSAGKEGEKTPSEGEGSTGSQEDWKKWSAEKEGEKTPDSDGNPSKPEDWGKDWKGHASSR